MNPYDELGIDSTATEKEVKKAYRSMAGKHHPDKGGDTEKFQQIQEAYEMLKDGTYNSASFDFKPETRWYQSSSKYQGDSGYEKYWSESKERQTTYRVMVTVEDLYNGCIRSGTQIGTFNIPKGAKHGDRLFVGDVRIELEFESDSEFSYTASGLDLYRGIRIPAIAAMLGTSVEFKHLDGKTYKLTIPKGTEDESIINMKGLGLYNRKTGERNALKVLISLEQTRIYDNEVVDLLKKKGYYKGSYKAGL